MQWNHVDQIKEEDIAAAAARVRRDAEWYERYNQRLEHMLVDEEVERLANQLSLLLLKHERALADFMSEISWSAWAQEETDWEQMVVG